MHIVLIDYIILIIASNDSLRCVVTSCKSWWAAGGSMGDSMPLIAAKSGREMLASWERMKFSLFCMTSLQGFCSSFTLIDLKASISPSYPQTEVILMCTEHFWMIRYMNMSYSEHFKLYVILWTRHITFGSINYYTYYIIYIHYVYYLFKSDRLILGRADSMLAWFSVL